MMIGGGSKGREPGEETGMDAMDRRTFIKQVGTGMLGASVCGGMVAEGGGPGAARAAPATPARVGLFVDPAVRKDGGLAAKRLSSLLEGAIGAALSTKDAAEGLRSLLKPGDVVGIKLNCLAGPPLSPSKETLEALTALLGRAGVSSERIIFFERSERDLTKGALPVRREGKGPLYLGNDSPGAGYEPEVEISGEVGSCLSRILTRRISVLISLGVLKDHNLAGVAGCLKNLYGLIHNPNKFHDNHCDPYVADVLSFPAVASRLKLSVLDGLTAQCEGGPGYVPEHAWPFNAVLASTDPVALDRIAADLLDQQRKKKGLPSLQQSGRPPLWLETASKRGLGTAELTRIQLIRGGSSA
jgi:uncharacterized protein (DUF362 family)